MKILTTNITNLDRAEIADVPFFNLKTQSGDDYNISEKPDGSLYIALTNGAGISIDPLSGNAIEVKPRPIVPFRP
jgi:hypothetical protein